MFDKILLKYFSLPVTVKTAFWFAICQFLQKGISMITTPVFTRLLSTTEYGIASTFVAWTSVVTPIITLSTWRAMMNLFSRDNCSKKVLSSCIFMSIFISFILSIVIFCLQEYIEKIASVTGVFLWLVIIFSVTQNIFFAWMTKLQYEYKYKPIIIATLLNTAITSIVGVCCVYFYSRTAFSKIYPQVICAFIISLYILYNSIRNSGTFFNKDLWWFSLGFSVPLIPHYLSEVILQSSDRIMINSLCSSSDVAIYSIAYSVANLIFLAVGSVNSSFVPYQYQKIKSREFKKLAVTSNFVIAFVAVVMFFVMLFGYEIVLIFGGRKYIESVSLIIPISLGVFFNYLFQLFARVQEYFEQKYTIVIASVACALLNIVLNYIFIRLYGYKAAAYTTFACYFFFCILHYFFYKKCCKKNIGREIYDIKCLSFISVILILSSFFINAVSNVFLIKYLILSVFILLFVFYRDYFISFIKRFV
ncbi:Membrane protein involved in the export of O-antigen and teichoic acid [Succinivibrio dextrinosolvens]|uniref:oligosaccharide flippase family protein n=1 Tax=Succinivibrio dextrinosolvens TaxID=83771 RepID=UPI0008E651A7|nr:oligosaccharide flippase family protein [Succinivibrio dextrinosolvens]SFS83224.1 Membrane protein involved in the export of O-antigen and teichoic acid [Succinivibrio dextrinosolvens]